MSPAEGQKLSLRALIGLVVGSMIGSGIFALPSAFGRVTGGAGALIAWTVAGVGMLMLAFVFQTLARRKPDLDSGIYAYAKAGFGAYPGFASAAGYWFGACLADVACLVLIKATLGLFIPAFGDGTTPFAAPGLGVIASAIMLAFGLWWLNRAAALATARGEPLDFDGPAAPGDSAENPAVRERATTAQGFDPAEARHSETAEAPPSILTAALPLVVVIVVNLVMSFAVLPRLDTAFLAEPRWGGTSLAAVGGVWSVVAALAAAIVTLLIVNGRRLPSLRLTMDAGANAAVLPAVSVASLVGFGAVVAAMPAFALVREWVLSIEGGPLVSLAFATNILSALTGSASGGLTIALDALGPTYMKLAAEHGISPSLMHRVAVIGAGTLDSLPHNGAVVTLLAVCGSTHGKSYVDIAMTAIVGALLALVAVIVLGGLLGTF